MGYTGTVMFIVFISLALLVPGIVIYFALSPRSSFPVKIAALTALGLIVLSIIVSLGLIFLVRSSGPGDLRAEYTVPVEQSPPRDGGLLIPFIFTLLMLALLGLIVIISLRRDRKKDGTMERRAA